MSSSISKTISKIFGSESIMNLLYIVYPALSTRKRFPDTNTFNIFAIIFKLFLVVFEMIPSVKIPLPSCLSIIGIIIHPNKILAFIINN